MATNIKDEDLSKLKKLVYDELTKSYNIQKNNNKRELDILKEKTKISYLNKEESDAQKKKIKKLERQIKDLDKEYEKNTKNISRESKVNDEISNAKKEALKKIKENITELKGGSLLKAFGEDIKEKFGIIGKSADFVSNLKKGGFFNALGASLTGERSALGQVFAKRIELRNNEILESNEEENTFEIPRPKRRERELSRIESVVPKLGEILNLNNDKLISIIEEIKSNSDVIKEKLIQISSTGLQSLEIERKSKQEERLKSEKTATFDIEKGPEIKRKAKKPSSLLGTLGLALAGILAGLYGMFTDGPFKGLSKIISKLFFGLANFFSKDGPIANILKTVKTVFGKLIKLVGPKSFLGKALKGIETFVLESGKVLSKIFGGELIKTITSKLSKGAFGGVLKNIAKTIFKGGTKTILKRIPIVGSLLSFGFAISRFIQGDIIGGLLDFASGALGFLDLLVPGLGTALSLGVDVLSTIRDLKLNPEQKKQQNAAVLTFFKTLPAKIWKYFMKSFESDKLKMIPFIGPFFSFGGAVLNFKKGNWQKGLMDIGGGILGIAPGLGAVYYGGINLLHTIFKGKKEQQPANLKENTNVLSNILKSIGGAFKKTFLFKWIMGFKTGFDKIMAGDITGGLLEVFKSLGAIVGTIASGPLGLFFGLFGNKIQEAFTTTDNTNNNTLWQKITNWFSDLWGSLKDLITDTLINKLKKFGENVSKLFKGAIDWVVGDNPVQPIPKQPRYSESPIQGATIRTTGKTSRALTGYKDLLKGDSSDDILRAILKTLQDNLPVVVNAGGSVTIQNPVSIQPNIAPI